jgi:hypothetical protein
MLSQAATSSNPPQCLIFLGAGCDINDMICLLSAYMIQPQDWINLRSICWMDKDTLDLQRMMNETRGLASFIAKCYIVGLPKQKQDDYKFMNVEHKGYKGVLKFAKTTSGINLLFQNVAPFVIQIRTNAY